MRIKFFVLFVLMFVFASYGQSNYFTSINVKTDLDNYHKWDVTVNGHCKWFHSNQGWTRLGADLMLRRKFEPWDLYAGIVSNNTLDKTEANYWELRPWLGIGLTNTIYKRLKFNQLFKFEWRNLIFSDADLNKVTTRYRYKLKPLYDFKKNWQVYASYEWYILPNKDLDTRFISSGELSFGVSKKISRYTIILSFTEEWYNKQYQPDANNANTLTLTFVF